MIKTSKKSLTRMNQLRNHIEERYNLDLNKIITLEDDVDQIERDIETQQILIIKKQKTNNIAQFKCDSSFEEECESNDDSEMFHIMVEDYKGKKWKVILFYPSQMIDIQDI